MNQDQQAGRKQGLQQAKTDLFELEIRHKKHAQNVADEELAGRSGSAVHAVERNRAEGAYRRVLELRAEVAELESGKKRLAQET